MKAVIPDSIALLLATSCTAWAQGRVEFNLKPKASGNSLANKIVSRVDPDSGEFEPGSSSHWSGNLSGGSGDIIFFPIVDGFPVLDGTEGNLVFRPAVDPQISFNPGNFIVAGDPVGFDVLTDEPKDEMSLEKIKRMPLNSKVISIRTTELPTLPTTELAILKPIESLAKVPSQVSIASHVPVQARVEAARLKENAFEFRAAGEASQQYVVERSTDLRSWTRIGAAQNQLGTLSFSDADTATSPRGFYRIRQAD